MSDKVLIKVKKYDYEYSGVQEMFDKYAGKTLTAYRDKDQLDQLIFVSARVMNDKCISTEKDDRYFYSEEVEVIEVISDRLFEIDKMEV